MELGSLTLFIYFLFFTYEFPFMCPLFSLEFPESASSVWESAYINGLTYVNVMMCPLLRKAFYSGINLLVNIRLEESI